MKKSKLFKSIDDRFKELGFQILDEHDKKCSYIRYYGLCDEYDIIHVIDIKYSEYTKGYQIESYDASTFDNSTTNKTSVPLTNYELKLVLKKIKFLVKTK